MNDLSKKRIRIAALVITDIVLINMAAFLALFVRVEMYFHALTESGFIYTIRDNMPLITICGLIMFTVFRLYSSMWEFAGTSELFLIVGASIGATLLQVFGMMLLDGYYLPRSYPFMYCAFLIALVAASRFSYRIIRRMRRNISDSGDGKKKRTMVIGAGAAGMLTITEFLGNPASRNKPVVLIDDDTSKQGRSIRGIKVEGGRDRIIEVASKYGIEEIVIAIPTLNNQKKKELIEICKTAGVPVKTLPSLSQLANGEVSIQKIRDIDIEDLLGRDEVKINQDAVSDILTGKTVLVTGGGGSIGSELCRQIAGFGPDILLVFDIYENTAYALQQELKDEHPELDLKVIIGSVRDMGRLESIFDAYRPDVVFHAAAHKHVPLMEDSPAEAIKNNVFGTYNVAACCDRYKSGRMVLISTDKAVRPTNIMGASKRICEMIVQMWNRKSETEYAAVRFGNVMGSNGSVIPLFKKQIEAGGPVTVTHKDIIRYFMTIPEAVLLILQACAYAKGGEVFVLDMGEPVKIDDLARNMIRLAGFEPDVDIKVAYTGLRPGEKLYEEMLLNEEGLAQTENRLIFIGQPIEMDDEGLIEWLKKIKNFINRSDSNFILSDTVMNDGRMINVYSSESVDEIKGMVKEIVPEYDMESYEMR